MRKLSMFVTIAFVGAACSSGGTATNPDLGQGPYREPLEIVLAAPQAALEQRTAKIDMDLYLEFEDSNIRLPGSGELDLAKGRGEFTFDLRTMFESFVEVPPGAPTKLKMAFTNTVMYLNVPPGMGEVPGGKAWVAIDAADFAKAGANQQTPFGIGGTDPKGMFDVLSGAVEVRQVDAEQVRGISTIEYEVVIDAKKAAQAAARAERAAMRHLMRSLSEERRFKMSVWISSDGLVRKQSITAPSEIGDTIIDVFYSDYGQPVTVRLPRPGETYRIRKAADVGRIFGTP